tara:strand:- start:1856 stop:1966 length:111 start_codon:yes stop_codon:yes gene_type:complete
MLIFGRKPSHWIAKAKDYKYYIFGGLVVIVILSAIF